MPHRGSKATSASCTVGLVVIGPPLAPSVGWGQPPSAGPSRYSVPRIRIWGDHSVAPGRLLPGSLRVPGSMRAAVLDRAAPQVGSAEVEGHLDGAALLLCGQGDERLAPLVETEGVRQHAGH